MNAKSKIKKGRRKNDLHKKIPELLFSLLYPFKNRTNCWFKASYFSLFSSKIGLVTCVFYHKTFHPTGCYLIQMEKITVRSNLDFMFTDSRSN